jgi:hypothetical protein
MHGKLPTILYHYTTAQGLLGILESGSLWATNSRFLNDPSEIEYATRLFRKITEEEFGEFDNPPTHGRSWKDWITFWLDYYEKEAKVYVACFCSNGDLLSQWRGYGAAGGGYAVGFATDHLSQADRNAQSASTDATQMSALKSTLTVASDFVMCKVIYNNDTQERLIRESLGALRRPTESKGTAKKVDPDPQAGFSRFFSECLNCLKNPAFEEEQEWRAIQFGRVAGRDRPNLKFYFRTSGGRIIDYTKLDLKAAEGRYQGRLPICVVRYGPTLEPKTTERSLKILLGAHGYNADLVKLERSQVPFSG